MRMLFRVLAVFGLAEQGQVYAMNLAGTMYWQGAAIAGSPVKTNLQQTRKLLAYAAVHGDVPAMAKMSELELTYARANPADASASIRYLEVPITYNSVRSHPLRATH